MEAIRMGKWIVVLAALFALVPSQSAMAQSIFASDCNTDFKNVFYDNEPVCAFGGAPGGSPLGGVALACVVPPGATSTAADVTKGGCNGISPFSSFWEEFLWLPPTTPGNYSVIIVNNQGGIAIDNIVILSSGGAAPTVDVAAIKAAAAGAAAPWQTVADWGEYLDEFASVISIAWSVGTGDWLSAAVGAAGLVTGQPTDYNGAVLAQGGQIISALAGQQAARYQSLADDPPDAEFTELFPLDISAINADLAALAPLKPGVPLEYPFNNLNQDPMNLASTALANTMAEEAALVFTLMRTLEKFQGAEIASDDQYTLLQAKGLVKYSDMLTAKLSNTRQLSLNYKAELAANGIADDVLDGAEVAALFARLESSGLTPEEEQSLRDAGFGDADIQLIFDRIAAFPAPPGTFSRSGALDAIVAATDAMLVATADLRGQAQEVVEHFAPLVTEQHPSADAGGPYNGDEGSPIDFNGSGSTDPQGQALTYEWDFDLDGQFDDATGASVSNTYSAPVDTQVGLKVTDTDGNSDISYATVVVMEVNGAPQITSFIPADLSPTASNLSPLDFSATASDPDLDNVSFEWALDGVVMSNADSWTYTPGIGETGTRSVRLTVSDLNPLSEDAIETRLVVLIEEVLVPDVVGDTQAVAEAAIVAAGLTVGTVDTESSDTVPAGDVISQDSAGGTVALLGSTVNLVVSIGPENVIVPNVVGQTQAAAEAAIVAADLAVGSVTTENSATVAEGDVISQNPAGGSSVAPGSSVDLVVSAGPDDVAVPNVVGQTQAAAEAAIVAADLAVGSVTTENSATVAAGDVISQNPAGGSSVAPGSSVDLVVSAGPEDVVVPSVVGQTQAAAEAAIAAAGLVPSATTANDGTVPAGDVISQDPAGGSSVAPGSTVNIVVSDGPAGLPPDAPENLLARAKGSQVNVTWQGSDTATNFRVFRRLDTDADFAEAGQVVSRVFVDDLPAGTSSADYYVVAENAFGQSAPSGVVTVAPATRR